MNLEKALAKVAACGLQLRLLRGKVKVITSENSTKLPATVHAWLKQNKAEVKENLKAEEKLVRFQGKAIAIQHWQGEQLGDTVCVDTETVLIPEDSPDEVPPLVIAAAYDGDRLFMFGPADAKHFMEVHKDRTFVFHNARFDVRVIEKATGEAGHLLQAIDEDRVYCTLTFEKLLNLATTGEPSYPPTRLEQCAQRYFSVPVPKDWLDEEGNTIRLSYGKHQGKTPAELPPCYLSYAALDPVATWHLLQAQKKRLPKIKKAAASAYGYTTKKDLEAAWEKFGPLSLHVQVKADVVFGYMSDHGLGRDFSRCEQLQADLQLQMKQTEEVIVKANLQPGKGSKKRLQDYMADVARRFPDEHFARTPTGTYSTGKEAKKKVFNLTKDTAIIALQEFDRARKWLSTYVQGMLDTAKLKLKVEWKILAKSGRTTTGSKKQGTALPAQCLPKDMLDTSSKVTVRQCLRPYPADHVFIGADYSTLEVVTFASELLRLKMGAELAEVVKAGRDVHRALAAAVYGVPEEEVTSEQRKTVKPFTFGIPGCMVGESLQRHAAGFGVKLSLEEVKHIYEGYARLNPAITKHLEEPDLGLRVAELMGAPAEYAWPFLGVMRGKRWGPTPDVAREWRTAYKIASAADISDDLKKKVLSLISQRGSSKFLFDFFRGLASKYSQLSPTGRLRAKADFRPTRNGLFQSVASDGGLLACWALFRQGFKPIAFVHDEIIAVTPRDGTEWEQCQALGEVMVEVMADLLQLPVKVEPFVRNSFSPKDDLAQPQPEAEPLPPADAFCSKPEADDDFEMSVGDADDDDGFVMGVATPKKRKRKADQCTDRFAAKVKANSFDDGDLPF